MAVRIRMKKMGRAHRHFFRICAADQKKPRDGRVLEELGTYDPMIKDVDARVRLNNERVDYWLGVGAQPSEKVAVLLKKYGSSGTHLDAQKAALEKLAMPTEIPDAGEPVKKVKTEEEIKAEEEAAKAAAEAEAKAAEDAKAEEAKAEGGEEAAADAPAEEAAAEEEKPAEEEAKSE